MDFEELTAESALDKSAERKCTVILTRSKTGLLVKVSGVREFEDLFQSWGEGPQDLKIQCRYWSPTDLQVWSVTSPVGLMMDEKGMPFRIDKPGQPLVEANNNYPMGGVLNLSFIRLVGISEGGVEFSVRSVQTIEEVLNLASMIKLALKAFYLSYMRTVKVAVVISTQRIQ